MVWPATAHLSRTVMWELGRSIDAKAHVRRSEPGVRFTSSTVYVVLLDGSWRFSARMVQSGVESALSADTRARLFSIAHNAMTNAFRRCRCGECERGAEVSAETAFALRWWTMGCGFPSDLVLNGDGEFAGIEGLRRTWIAAEFGSYFRRARRGNDGELRDSQCSC